MIIRKLELQGFKSFPDRVTLHFGPGISGVVGPNGCGKSNIVDAIKWCLGEQSARSLRGKAMQDVIFAGSETRKPTGLAEVVLTFASDGEPFPGEYARLTELQVSRRLFRDGHSEYLLNQQRARLRDIQDLFLDSGVGNRMYSFIEQGRIGQIVSARPEQRRSLIEEAAGISRFKARKDEAEQRLSGTLQNLERATDVVEDLAARIRALERQVARAMRYRRLRSFIRQAEILLGLARYAALAADRRVLAGELREAEHAEADAMRVVEQSELALRAGREQVEVMATGVAGLRDALAELEARRRESESARQYQSRELEQLQVRVTQLAGQEADARGRAAETAKRASQTDEERARLDAQLRLLEADLATIRNAVTDAQQAVRDRRQRIDSAKTQVLQLVKEVAAGEAEREGMSGRLRDLSQRRDTLRSRRDQSGQVVEATGKEGAEALQAVSVAEVAEAQVKAALEGAAAALRASQEAHQEATRGRAAADQRVRLADREATRLRARLESLEALQAEHAGVDDVVKEVLSVEGVLGTLSAELDVPEDLEGLVAVALGEALDAIRLRSPDVALAVASRSRGGLTLLLEGSEQDGVDGWSAALGGASGPAARSLLTGLELVPDLKTALERWTSDRSASLVASVGAAGPAIVRSDGLVRVGLPQLSGTALLARRREIGRLQAGVEEAQATFAREERVASDAAEMVAARAAELEKARAAHAASQQAASEASLRVREARAREQAAARERRRHEDEHARIAAEITDLTARIDKISELSVRRKTNLAAARTRQAQVEQALQADQSALVRESRDLGEAREAQSSSGSRVAGLRERVAGLARTSSDLAEAMAAAEREAATASRDQAQAGTRIVELRDDDVRLASLLQEIGEEQAGVRSRLEQDRAVHAAAKAELDSKEAALTTLRDERETRSQARQGLDRRVADVRAEIGRIRESIDERYQLSVAGLLDRIDRVGHVVLEADVSARETELPGVGEAKGAELSWTEDLTVTARLLEDQGQIADWLDRLRHAKDSLRRLGEVNLVAVREYAEVSERHAQLEAQRADLEESVRTIRQTIGKLNRTCRERFRDTFDRVDAFFRELYPRLVGGGGGRLQLTDEEDLLQTGVDIVVQPPGKRLQSLSLLSGGETAMVAIALIFALFRVKPSPFCLLDEVDAPLDEGNGARFNEALRQMADLAQFIVITHNKKTMECADTLYGVTMNVPGVSQLVTVKLE